MDEKTAPTLSDLVTKCMHCGLCLPHCPTYALTTMEKSSPRGRIRLIKAVADGELAIGKGFIDEMFFCLDCRACETACPAGVHYGELVESARAEIDRRAKRSLRERFVRFLFLKLLFPYPARLRMVGRVMRLLQSSGAMRGAQSLAKRFPPSRYATMMDFAPAIAEKFSTDLLPSRLGAHGKRKGRVAVLTGCVTDMAFPEMNTDTVDVLVHNGYEVFTIPSQVCCGSLHGHLGDIATARRLARRNIALFLKEEVDFVIVNSAGCGSFMKHYDRLFPAGSAHRQEAERFVRKVKDISEFLVEEGFERPANGVKKTVAYHEACHLVHGQGVSRQPKEILMSIPGITLVDLPEATWCCGSAGVYNITHPEDSLKLLDRKMEHILSTGAEVVAAGNPGCLLQLRAGVRMRGKQIDILHPISLLRMAYGRIEGENVLEREDIYLNANDLRKYRPQQIARQND